MPGSMAPLKKPQNTKKLPLALNPLKSKDVLAVLAERNQAIVPVGAWVEPASPGSSEIPAYTSAYVIEEELKEQLRKKQEALKRFQRQVKHRVNQQIRLRKKQQWQRSSAAAGKEGSIALQSSDPAHRTPKRAGVLPNNLKAAIENARLPPSQMLGGEIEDRENQDELLQQQAQALSQTLKQARQQLAAFKTVSEMNAAVFPDDRRKNFSTQEVSDSEESSSVTTEEKGRMNLFSGNQQDPLSEDKDKPLSRVQKVQFKNPLFAVTKEEELKQLHLQGHQEFLPETQDHLPEAQGDLLETQGGFTGVQSVEPRLSTQTVELEGQAIEQEAQVVKTETQGILLEAQSPELEDGSIVLDFLPKDQTIQVKCQDQDILPKDQNILPKCVLKNQHQDFLPKDELILSKDQNVLPKGQDHHFLPQDQCVLPKDQNILLKYQDQDFLPRDEKVYFKKPYSGMTNEKGREDFSLAGCQYPPPKLQDQAFIRDQNIYLRQQPFVETTERWQEELHLDGHRHLPPKHQRGASSRRQVYDEYQSGLNTGFPLALQSGVDQEEKKKERQKQYLRYRRLFMDIEREQVREQQRQKEHRKKIDKIKKKKEQQHHAEEQRILRVNLQEELCSGENMSDKLAQLQLEEMKGAREKQQQQKDKEYQRYVEALRVQIQEKMRLYNVTLPALCCCGPGFWDAHPDSCANNCIFYKNHRAYMRALHSVINSCDIPEESSALRVAILNFASAHRRSLKNP
ncbi:coiled-coil domain-containing protein 15 isoform X2 [Manis pentadactyla]|uniref:coiled-coil domain-containing protein 15 isoform X2 n=1 Tax=Manis pentadactyla TaxID=143292 RepID=UPI00255CEDE0|nr:coiled-coil domain-containing protein 15 isoform X2 [Manis pentadactyla]